MDIQLLYEHSLQLSEHIIEKMQSSRMLVQRATEFSPLHINVDLNNTVVVGRKLIFLSCGLVNCIILRW